MRKILLVMMLAFSPFAYGDLEESATKFMQDLGDKVLDIIQKFEGKDKREALRNVFEKNIHHKNVAKFVLAKERRIMLQRAIKEMGDQSAAKERVRNKLEEFYEVYKESIIRTYLSSFEKEYKNETLSVKRATISGSGGATVISALDRGNGAPPVALHWILKCSCGNGNNKCSGGPKEWKIVDLRVENVSQAGKERSESASVMNRYQRECTGDDCALAGIDGLIKEHKKLNEEWRRKYEVSPKLSGEKLVIVVDREAGSGPVPEAIKDLPEPIAPPVVAAAA